MSWGRGPGTRCAGQESVKSVEMVGTYIEGQAGEVDGGAEGEEGSEEGSEEEVAAGPERGKWGEREKV